MLLGKIMSAIWVSACAKSAFLSVLKEVTTVVYKELRKTSFYVQIFSFDYKRDTYL
jgi:hypothetical protein